jgi:hypothetical protein
VDIFHPKSTSYRMRLSHEACAKITILERMLSKTKLFFIKTQALHSSGSPVKKKK